ncbi:MAG: hypothetical protein KBA61_13920 [Spirochaetes bacterium]|nr:hypothetical protein [Spirochaetota bacterium]
MYPELCLRYRWNCDRPESIDEGMILGGVDTVYYMLHYGDPAEGDVDVRQVHNMDVYSPVDFKLYKQESNCECFSMIFSMEKEKYVF